jgi:hypothetical protein
MSSTTGNEFCMVCPVFALLNREATLLFSMSWHQENYRPAVHGGLTEMCGWMHKLAVSRTPRFVQGCQCGADRAGPATGGRYIPCTAITRRFIPAAKAMDLPCVSFLRVGRTASLYDTRCIFSNRDTVTSGYEQHRSRQRPAAVIMKIVPLWKAGELPTQATDLSLSLRVT